jgi:hypothetical protein
MYDKNARPGRILRQRHWDPKIYGRKTSFSVSFGGTIKHVKPCVVKLLFLYLLLPWQWLRESTPEQSDIKHLKNSNVHVSP